MFLISKIQKKKLFFLYIPKNKFLKENKKKKNKKQKNCYQTLPKFLLFGTPNTVFGKIVQTTVISV